METIKIMSVEKDISIDALISIKSLTAAIKTSIRISGMSEKQVSWELELDQSYWSRILNGCNQFPADKLIKLCEIVCNDIPLQWLAYQRGYELRVIPTELEEQLIQKTVELKELKDKFNYMEEMLLKLGAKLQYG